MNDYTYIKTIRHLYKELLRDMKDYETMKLWDEHVRSIPRISMRFPLHGFEACCDPHDHTLFSHATTRNRNQKRNWLQDKANQKHFFVHRIKNFRIQDVHNISRPNWTGPTHLYCKFRRRQNAMLFHLPVCRRVWFTLWSAESYDFLALRRDYLHTKHQFDGFLARWGNKSMKSVATRMNRWCTQMKS